MPGVSSKTSTAEATRRRSRPCFSDPRLCDRRGGRGVSIETPRFFRHPTFRYGRPNRTGLLRRRKMPWAKLHLPTRIHRRCEPVAVGFSGREFNPFRASGGNGAIKLHRTQARFPAPINQCAIVGASHVVSPGRASSRAPLPCTGPAFALRQVEKHISRQRRCLLLEPSTVASQLLERKGVLSLE
jgi:hypothetical protein